MLSSKPKIVYIDESSALGGAEEYLRMLINGLSKSFEMTLVHPDDNAHMEFYQNTNCAKITIPLKKYEKSKSLLTTYLNTFRNISVDLLHVNLPAPNYCRTAILAGRFCGITATVATNHLPNLTFPRSPLGVIAGRSIFDWAIWRSVFKIITTSIVVSESSAKSLVKNYPTTAGKVKCIYNGIDPYRFLFNGESRRQGIRKEFGISSNEVLATSVGRLHHQKGYGDLLTAMKLVIRKGVSAKLLLVGDGPLRADLSKMVDGLDLNSSVVFAGERNDIPEILSASDVYVNSSLFEGLPFTILEAMASGLAVVATSVDGNKEVVLDTYTGLVVPPSDAKSLANALITVLENESLRNKYGGNGKTLVEEKFTIEKMLKQTEHLYRKSMGN